jgi:hypothetical protein
MSCTTADTSNQSRGLARHHRFSSHSAQVGAVVRDCDGRMQYVLEL